MSYKTANEMNVNKNTEFIMKYITHHFEIIMFEFYKLIDILEINS